MYFAREMFMALENLADLRVLLMARKGSSTQVTIIFTNLPLGVRPEDNEKGTEESLDKLEQYLTK